MKTSKLVIDDSKFCLKEIRLDHGAWNENLIPSQRKINCSCCEKARYCWQHKGSKCKDYTCINCYLINGYDKFCYDVYDLHGKLIIDKNEDVNNYTIKGKKINENKLKKEKPILECQWVRVRDYQ